MHYEQTPLQKLDEYSEKFESGAISAREYLEKFRDSAKHVPYDPALSMAAKALRIQLDFSAAKPSRVSETDRKEAMDIFAAAIKHDSTGLAPIGGAGASGATLQRDPKAFSELDRLSEKFAAGQLSASEYIDEFRETAARAPADPKQSLSAKALQIQIDFDAAPEGTVTEAHRDDAMEIFADALHHDRVPVGHEAQLEHLVETSAKGHTPKVGGEREPRSARRRQGESEERPGRSRGSRSAEPRQEAGQFARPLSSPKLQPRSARFRR